MDPEQIGRRLSDIQLGGNIEYHRKIASTSDRAVQLAEQGAREGTIVLAESQTAGRGRRGRRWHDVSGHSLLVSVVLRPPFIAEKYPVIGLAAATACAHACNECGDVAVGTKWPNDIVTELPASGERDQNGGHAKLGGLLLQTAPESVIVGCGVNVKSSPRIPPNSHTLPPVSIKELSDRDVSRAELLEAFLRRFADLYELMKSKEFEAVVKAFVELDTTIGNTVSLATGDEQFTGQAISIASDGALVVAAEDGHRTFRAGEVSLVTPPSEIPAGNADDTS